MTNKDQSFETYASDKYIDNCMRKELDRLLDQPMSKVVGMPLKEFNKLTSEDQRQVINKYVYDGLQVYVTKYFPNRVDLVSTELIPKGTKKKHITKSTKKE